ncbi:MAG TPA: filamentous hemagglutinin family protein [Rhizomicrobium sp.]|nr:filamentous hemagglutinin family protein [Rhizomicrobium sp.]
MTTYGAVNIDGAVPLSTGASLVEAVFDPVNPLAGFGPAPGSLSFSLGSILLHQNDSRPDLFYAATGDIVAPWRESENVKPSERVSPLAWEITKTAKVRAARDIIDLFYFGQNLQPTDITAIIAGRDLYYTGASRGLRGEDGIPRLGVMQNPFGLSLAGPGFFDVEAGRNMGPFVTAATNSSLAGGPGSPPTFDPVGTGIMTFGNAVTVGNRRMFSSQDPTKADPFATGANNKLARRGADIVALFGVGGGVDYAAVVQNYVDPVHATSPRSYLPALANYLQTLGYPRLSEADAWTAFETLPAGLQQIFAGKVFLSEIKLPGQPDGCCYKDYSVAYSMINTLFPVSRGYTDNGLTAEARPVLRHTGNLDLLHAVIKTQQGASMPVVNADGTTSAVVVGGNITVLGPGGSINIGTTAREIRDITLTPAPPQKDPYPGNKLSNSSLGILTLRGGAISTFTDVSVLVNQSRVLTAQGGDVLMWSSNGDLDAGRGAKTSVDFKPLSVNFDSANLQTINLNGLVSGAGIGTIRSTPDAPAASATLIAPRGTINAGDAGLRSTGNLDILAFLVLNAANIAVSGNVSGVPEVNAVNLSALESASAAGGQAAQIADASVAAAASRGTQSVIRSIPALFTVEILGFGDCDPEGGRSCSVN